MADVGRDFVARGVPAQAFARSKWEAGRMEKFLRIEMIGSLLNVKKPCCMQQGFA